jgi:hypothetical protein
VSRASAPRNRIFLGACAPPDLPLHERSDEAIMTLNDPKFGKCRQICATANSTDGCRKAYEGGFLNIIGISAGYHDSACCLMQRGRIVAAAQEERFSRIKNDKAFPAAAFS